MAHAIELAKAAAATGNYPLGALVIDAEGTVVATAASGLVKGNDPTAHPEIVAIRRACDQRHSRYLPGCILITTLEPCPMCTSAVIWAKMQGVAFGSSQDAALRWARSHPDEIFSWRQITIGSIAVAKNGNPVVSVAPGVMAQECDQLFELTPYRTDPC